MSYAYVFGPVVSSRLGRSLGLDLLGRRVCSMDCLYCEVGATHVHTMERSAVVSSATVLDELERWAAENTIALDHVTLGGSGEPCLNTELGAIIAGCRRILPGVPVAVLTNTTLLHLPEVCEQLMQADVVLPSLDSLVEREFRAINRPVSGVTAQAVAQALLAFRRVYTGRIYLEVLLLEGVNDSEENLALLRAFVRQLHPDRVDVTTLSRPGTWARALPVGRDVLDRWTGLLAASLPATVDVASRALQEAATPTPGCVCDCATRQGKAPADTQTPLDFSHDAKVRESLVASLRRRPQTTSQLALALGLPMHVVETALAALHAEHVAAHVADHAATTGAGAAATPDAEPFWTLTGPASGA